MIKRYGNSVETEDDGGDDGEEERHIKSKRLQFMKNCFKKRGRNTAVFACVWGNITIIAALSASKNNPPDEVCDYERSILSTLRPSPFHMSRFFQIRPTADIFSQN